MVVVSFDVVHCFHFDAMTCRYCVGATRMGNSGCVAHCDALNFHFYSNAVDVVVRGSGCVVPTRSAE